MRARSVLNHKSKRCTAQGVVAGAAHRATGVTVLESSCEPQHEKISSDSRWNSAPGAPSKSCSRLAEITVTLVRSYSYVLQFYTVRLLERVLVKMSLSQSHVTVTPGPQ